jgi:hypothetical protein
MACILDIPFCFGHTQGCKEQVILKWIIWTALCSPGPGFFKDRCRIFAGLDIDIFWVTIPMNHPAASDGVSIEKF